MTENPRLLSAGVQIYVKTTTSDRNILQQQVNALKIDPLDQIFEYLHKKEQVEKEEKSYLRIYPLTGIFYDNTVIYDTADKGDRRNVAVMDVRGIYTLSIPRNFPA